MAYVRTKNNLKARSVPVIALSESNDNGGHYFMSLFMGKRIHSYKWTELPITDEVITQVEALARTENQPTMATGLPIFEWAPGEPIDDDFSFDVDADDNDDDAPAPHHAADNEFVFEDNAGPQKLDAPFISDNNVSTSDESSTYDSDTSNDHDAVSDNSVDEFDPDVQRDAELLLHDPTADGDVEPSPVTDPNDVD